MRQTRPTRTQRTPGLPAGELNASNKLLECTACCAAVLSRSPAGAASQAGLAHPAARHHQLDFPAYLAVPRACCSAELLPLSMSNGDHLLPRHRRSSTLKVSC